MEPVSSFPPLQQPASVPVHSQINPVHAPQTPLPEDTF